MEFDKKLFCKKLLSLREQKGYSQAQIADILGISQATYSAYELGNHNVSIQMFCKMLDVFDVSAEWLLGLAENKQLSSNDSRMIDAFKQFLISDYKPQK